MRELDNAQTVSIKFDKEVYQTAKKVAKVRRMSVTKLINLVLKQQIEKDEDLVNVYDKLYGGDSNEL